MNRGMHEHPVFTSRASIEIYAIVASSRGARTQRENRTYRLGSCLTFAAYRTNVGFAGAQTLLRFKVR